jgi:hypothetical protein
VVVASVAGLAVAPARAERPTAQASITTSPSVSQTPSSPDKTSRTTVIGLVFLTAFGAAGFYLARWLRRDRPPRPPGPFGSIGRRPR